MLAMAEQAVLTDVLVRVGGHYAATAHRAVLAAGSPFFMTCFAGPMLAHQHQHVVDVDAGEGVLTAEAVETVLQFIYVGECVVDTESVAAVLAAADFLQVARLRELCGRYLEEILDVETCLTVWDIAESAHLRDLVLRCRGVAVREFARLRAAEDFFALQAHQLASVLESDGLNMAEEDVFAAVLAWVRADLPARRACLDALWPLVRFPLMSSAFLTQVVEHEELLVRHKLGSSLLAEAHRYLMHPDSRPDLVSPRTRPREAHVYLICGGDKFSYGYALRSAVFYSSRGRRWDTTPAPACARLSCAAAVVEGRVYVAGGVNEEKTLVDGLERYVPRDNVWETVARLPVLRQGCTMVAVGRVLLVIGGVGSDGVALATVDRYNTDAGEWLPPARPMSTARGMCSACVLDGFVYVIGGWSQASGTMACVERYDPASNQWAEMPPLSAGRQGSCASVLNGCLYVTGGLSAGHEYLSSTEMYRPADGVWRTVGSLVTGRFGACAFTLDGVLWVAGGKSAIGAVALRSMERYVALEDRWEVAGNLPLGRMLCGCAVVDA
jgi:N-acetylneuraminic acid mutarotase